MKNNFTVYVWAVIGNCGLYVDFAYTRKDMIENHCSSLGRTWEYCRKKGDRCIKVTVTDGWNNRARKKIKKAQKQLITGDKTPKTTPKGYITPLQCGLGLSKCSLGVKSGVCEQCCE